MFSAYQLQVQSLRHVECEEWAGMDALTSTNAQSTTSNASALGSSAGQIWCLITHDFIAGVAVCY